MKIVHRKSSFTLLELLIAAALTAILLTAVSFFFRYSALLNQQSEKDKKESFQIRYIEARLMLVITNIQREYHALNKKFFYFFTETDQNFFAPGSQNLVFVYNNGADINPDLSENTLGRLYLDRKKRLCLSSWSSPDHWEEKLPQHAKQEVLLENVESLAFQFYSPPEKDRSKIDMQLKEKPPEIEPEKGQWLSEWKQEYHHIPPMIRIIITKKIADDVKDRQLIFAFPCPNSTKVVLYDS